MEKLHLLKQYNVVIIRYSEIWLKSQKVKIRMLKILMDNIKNALNRNGVPFNKYQLSKDSSRIFFFFKNKDMCNAIEVLKKVFGIYSISPTLRTSNKINNISERVIEIAKEILQKGDTFALRVRRSGTHEFTSIDVARIVGKNIIEELSDYDLKVNLSNPNKKIFIEIRDDFSYIFSQIIKTPWVGLPIESPKKMFVMDVGRIYDLIAGFMLMKRGSNIYPILFSMINNRENDNIWESNWRELLAYTPYSNFTLIKINLLQILEKIVPKINNPELVCGICRLTRFKLIGNLKSKLEAKRYDKIRAFTDGLTLTNTSYCDDTVDLESIALCYLFLDYPIFTPLIGFDAEEINKLREKISRNLKIFDYCKLKPQNQNYNQAEILKVFNDLDIEPLIDEALKNMTKISISLT
ncbi:MAG: THUMP domain-containing protein [Candidatus Lokiarchaeota archaeon]|nr:THUMP domain-containing protein [Candidatus Lokiarchaeota archaeon]